MKKSTVLFVFKAGEACISFQFNDNIFALKILGGKARTGLWSRVLLDQLINKTTGIISCGGYMFVSLYLGQLSIYDQNDYDLFGFDPICQCVEINKKHGLLVFWRKFIRYTVVD